MPETLFFERDTEVRHHTEYNIPNNLQIKIPLSFFYVQFIYYFSDNPLEKMMYFSKY